MPDTADGSPVDFVTAGARRGRQRADAARNRERVLAAAEELFAELGVGAVTMDAVAARAGVGKGTLYRGFGDKGGLAVALLDARERELQERLLSGRKPFDRRTPPAHRLEAFVVAYLRLAVAQLDLLLMSETNAPLARQSTGVHGAWVLYCTSLLAEGGAPDPDLRAEALLAMLSAEQVAFWVRNEQRSLADLERSLSTVARLLCN
ncbi:TetR/AcrR family transcriptional regulator [Desertimonas flava]|uniref:TetR/AcrR family transcriptional regulator n=1 Tax=Desertimonas flava TaxID=2064846 RepID=UPI000E3430F9|nr:TetR/AcrR family transcriptional regulator [Desertimonas flava]